MLLFTHTDTLMKSDSMKRLLMAITKMLKEIEDNNSFAKIEIKFEHGSPSKNSLKYEKNVDY